MPRFGQESVWIYAGCATPFGAPVKSSVTTTFPSTSLKVAVPASPDLFWASSATVAIFASGGAGAARPDKKRYPPIATIKAAANIKIVLSNKDVLDDAGLEDTLLTRRTDFLRADMSNIHLKAYIPPMCQVEQNGS